MISILDISLGIAFLLSTSTYSIEWIDCGLPKSFQVETDNKQHVSVYDAEIRVKYDRNKLAVYEYPDSNFVNFLINETIVSFEGHIIEEGEDSELVRDTFKTSRIFVSQLAGSAQLIKTDTNNILADCTAFLSRNSNYKEYNIPKNLQIEIIHEAASCVKSSICQRLGVIKAEDMKRANDNPFSFGQLSASGRLLNDNNTKPITVHDVKSLIANYGKSDNVNTHSLQSAINKLVDVAIAEIVQKIKSENQGKIHIPDLSENFSTGSSWWKTTGEFNSYKGTFEDLTTLLRTEDASVSRTGLKFIASCGVGLSRAFMQYEKYKLRYGIMKVNGMFSARVDGVALYGTVWIDYNQKPCRAVLQSMRISELGKVKIKITGLGPLNNMLSKLVTWITKKWKNEIVKYVENKLTSQTEDYLEKFNCEKYRP